MKKSPKSTDASNDIDLSFPSSDPTLKEAQKKDFSFMTLSLERALKSLSANFALEITSTQLTMELIKEDAEIVAQNKAARNKEEYEFALMLIRGT